MNDLVYYLRKIMLGKPLSQGEAESVMYGLMHSQQHEQKAAILSVLTYRGISCDEMMGFIDCLLKEARPLVLDAPVLDIVGTGGDQAQTINISTGSAIVAAASGVKVVKHGNRAVSSQCGSADVLAELNIQIEMTADEIRQSVNMLGIAFVYAPLFNPGLGLLSATRKRLNMATVINQLGPLINPARPSYRMIGVARKADVLMMAKVIALTSEVQSAFVFHGHGLDELTCIGPIDAYRIQQGHLECVQIDPQKLGFKQHAISALRGGDITTNADLLVKGLEGHHEAITDTFILNAGVALMVAGVVSHYEEGIHLARNSIREGRAIELLHRWIAASNVMKHKELSI